MGSAVTGRSGTERERGSVLVEEAVLDRVSDEFGASTRVGAFA